HHGEGIEGGDARAAVDFARRAGDAANANAAFDEAADLYERALAALEHTPADKRVEAEVLLEVAEARNRARNNRAAYTPLLAAAALARELDDTDLLVRAALGFSYEWDFNSWRHPEVVELARDALDRVPEGSVRWVIVASH